MHGTQEITRFSHAKRESLVPTSPEAGVVRRVGVFGKSMLLAEHKLEKGWTGAMHSHPHDQIAYVVAGKIRVICEKQSVELGSGESFLVAGGVEHQSIALEDSVVLDIFTPCREDFLESPAYGREIAAEGSVD